MSEQQVFEFFRLLSTAIPDPKTALNYSSDFELLIAVMLSAQATDVSVNKATEHLFKVANTPQKILDLGELGLKKFIQKIGLYNSKAKHIIQTCEILRRDHDSMVPEKREALERLPGVGRKTANVVLSTAMGQSTIAVDTHVFRVSNRTGLATGKTVLKVELTLYERVPPAYLKQAHHLLILHGRSVCKAKRPACHQCVVNHLCTYSSKTQE